MKKKIKSVQEQIAKTLKESRFQYNDAPTRKVMAELLVEQLHHAYPTLEPEFEFKSTIEEESEDETMIREIMEEPKTQITVNFSVKFPVKAVDEIIDSSNSKESKPQGK